jgi:hypothetical protein
MADALGQRAQGGQADPEGGRGGTDAFERRDSLWVSREPQLSEDLSHRSKAVPSDENSLRVVSDVTSRPCEYVGGCDPIRLLRELGRR